MKEKYITIKIMNSKGQALIIMIVAIAVSLLVLTSAVLRSIDQAKLSARSKLGQTVYYAAEAGTEYGLIKTMRNPSGCSGSDVLTVGSATVNVTYNITGGNCQIVSEASQGNLIKKIEVLAAYDSEWIFNYSSWDEIP